MRLAVLWGQPPVPIGGGRRPRPETQSGRSSADSTSPTPNAATNSPSEAPVRRLPRGRTRGLRGRRLRRAKSESRRASGACAPPSCTVPISRRSQPATSSPHAQPTVATPSDERKDTNDGQAEQWVRPAGAASIGQGSPTARCRTVFPHGCGATRDGGTRWRQSARRPSACAMGRTSQVPRLFEGIGRGHPHTPRRTPPRVG